MKCDLPSLLLTRALLFSIVCVWNDGVDVVAIDFPLGDPGEEATNANRPCP